MSAENATPAGEVIGSGRFQRKPLATLSRMAAAAVQEDARLPTPAEIDDLISYLTLAKNVGGMTFRQMDAFWDLNRQLMVAQEEVRAFYRDRPAYGRGPCPEPKADLTARRWLNALDSDERDTVIKAAHAQFKDEFPVAEVEDPDLGTVASRIR